MPGIASDSGPGLIDCWRRRGEAGTTATTQRDPVPPSPSPGTARVSPEPDEGLVGGRPEPTRRTCREDNTGCAQRQREKRAVHAAKVRRHFGVGESQVEEDAQQHVCEIHCNAEQQRGDPANGCGQLPASEHAQDERRQTSTRLSR
jgi:hypothetical protein